MQTQCPSCRSVFRVSHQQLSAAGGMVRCGRCSVIFNGNENIKRLRSDARAPSAVAPRRAPAHRPPASVGAPRSAPWRGQPPSAEAPPEQRSPPHAEPGSKPDKSKAERLWPQARKPSRTELEQATHPQIHDDLAALGPPPRKHHVLRAAVVVVALALLLPAGYLFYQREPPTSDSLVFRWARAACGYIGCELPPRRDLNRIHLLDRNVFTRPDSPNILRISATLVNRAPFAQPYPAMQVSFTNLQGTPVATRRFEPDEYLSPGADPGALMATGKPIKVSVSMPDPGSNASAFEFTFL